ncbi:MAG: aryl-sulfate sulfotransferase, partial [Gammaproteobacteria bacterium]|nr:aryl-sulfate sulfotransferase [Gammaproteobacteria bacterium]
YAFRLPNHLVQFDVEGDRFFEWGDFVLSRAQFAAIHHDMHRLPNGNTLVLCAALVDEPAISPNTLVDDCLMELDWEGNIVWEWYTFEHFDQFGFSDEAKQMISDMGGDWGHANSLSIIPANTHSHPAFTPGNIMISYRQLNTIVVIDRQTGDIVWKIGPENSVTIGQHDAYMIAGGRPGAGNIMAFDNGLRAGFPPVSRPFSQVVEIDPMTNQVVWSYNATFSGFPQWDFFSPIISGAQRLENGNTMITEGTKGRLFEIAPNGEIVWEFWNPYYEPSIGPTGLEVRNYSVFRAYRMPLWWGWPSSLR